MKAHAAKIAIFFTASLIAGLTLAETTPNDLRSARSSALEALGQPQIEHYPGEDRVIIGPDSYPIEYSPQYLAAIEASQRARAARYAMPPVPGYADRYQPDYAQPSAAQDARLQQSDGQAEPANYGGNSRSASVTVRRGSTAAQPAAPAPPEAETEAAPSNANQGHTPS